MGDLAQHLVGEGSEHPPGPAFLLPEHRQQLFTVGGDGEAVFALLLQPDLHILPGDVPAILSTQADVLEGLTAHKDVPVLQHLLGGVLLEVDQLKQLDLVALRGEDQLVLLAIEAHLERDLIKNQIQGFLHLGYEFGAAGVVLVLVHHLAQFCFHLGKGFPPVLCPLPEALRELRQGDALLAPVDQLHGVLVVGAGLQCLFKVTKSPALLIQIVIGIAHAKVPVVVSLKVFLMRFQESDGLFEHSSAFQRSVICLVVVRPCKLAVHFRSALLNTLQCFNDLVMLVVLMPLLELLQNIHIRVLLVLIRFPVFNLLEHAVLIPRKGTRGGGVQQRDDIGIVVADGVETVDPSIVWVVHVLVTLITGGEAPAAVPAAVRFLPVAVAYLAALHRDTVGGDTAIGTLPVGEQIFYIFRLYMVVPVAARGFVQLLPQHLHLISHIRDLILAHHLTDVIGQGILDKVRQDLIHGLVFLWRGGDADAADGGVVLVQILKVHTAADAALQQNGGQVGDHINGEVEVHLHTIGMCKLQVLHGLAKVPVLLVQTDLGKNLAEGDFLFLLVF